MLTGLVRVTDSAYNPIDTVLIYIGTLSLFLYAITFGMAMLLGLSTQLFGDDFLTPVTLVVAGILIAVIAIPLGIDSANRQVRDADLDTLGITFSRFLGVGVIVLVAWLMYKYAVHSKQENGGKPNGENGA